MFDFRRHFNPLLGSEQAAAPLKVLIRTLQRCAWNRVVVGLHVGKLWRFRAPDLDEWSQKPEPEQMLIDSRSDPRYSVLNHSCPQPDRR